ncbi:MAG: extracellular solute-binding protein [Woeseiaceae bacterium]|nr:extracellular solute-binding protein [Woeseiaceae bacterium]
MSRRNAGLLALLFLVAACGGKDKPALEERPEPLIVYASYEDTEYLPEFFRAFTDETGVYVTVRHQPAAANVANMIDGHNQRPADVFVAGRAADAWQVAENGGLRPLYPESYADTVPESMRDAEGYWAAWSFSEANVVFASGATAVDAANAWQAIAGQAYDDALCMSSSNNPGNRSLIAHMIRKLGKRDAEILVRSWLRNLALPPLDTDLDVLEAVDAGTCEAGIVFSQAVSRHQQATGDDSKHYVRPAPAYADAEVVGVARHARQAELAQQLVAWMLSPEQQRRHARATGRLPALDGQQAEPVGAAAWYDEEAALLIERVVYR